MPLKNLLDRTLAAAGLQLRRRRSHFVDAFEDQAALLRATGKPVKSVVDVGASYGEVTARYRLLFPEAMVYVFEPTEEPFRALQRRFEGDPHVRLRRGVIGEKVGVSTFHYNAFDETNSLLAADPRASEVAPLRTGRVESMTLDAFVEIERLDSIDVLKMDIQGAELLALRHGENLLSRGAIRMIYCEVLFAPMYQGQAYYHDVAAHLHSFGYDPYGLYHLIRGPGGKLAWGDAIFLSPDLAATLK